MNKGLFVSIVALSTIVGAARGDEQEADRPAPVVPPLKVQVVFTRMLGDKKISSMPYTLATAGQGGASIRMGIQVPLTVKGEGSAPATVMFKDIGTNLDCRAEALEGGRYRLELNLEQGSLASGDWGAVSSTPVLRNFKSRSNLVLRDGQTGQFVSATDPVTGEVLHVDVTLNVIK